MKQSSLQKQFLIFTALFSCITWLAAGIGLYALISMEASHPALTIVEIVVIIAALALSIYCIRSIGLLITPLHECAKRLEKLAQGDLHSPLPAATGKYELDVLIVAVEKISKNLISIINDEKRMLAAMSSGDFTVSSDCHDLYINDFAELLEAMKKICLRLNSTLHQILESATQVDTSAQQVSSGAQALSQGATEQASSIQELAATLDSISTQVNESSHNAHSASDLANSVGNDMMDSNLHMSEMTNSMAEIKESAGQVGKIIKTIEDIAFQTNILSLNAAVEAARAGSAGKGFAVVADEVRNLAEKSQQAAQDTTLIIQNAISAVDKGTKLADETAESMNKVVANAQLVVDQISMISEASSMQADALLQVNTGLDQISSVVQTNSATAQQNAAASEELSGQADLLQQLLSDFKFMKSSDASPVYGKSASLADNDQRYYAESNVEKEPISTFNSDKY